MVKHRLLPLLCLACGLPALAADRIVADGAFSADSDGLRERSADLGYVHPLPSLGRQASLGVRAGYWLLADNSDRIEFGTLKLDGQGRSGALDWRARVQQFASNGWSPSAGGFGFDYHAGSRWTVSTSGDFDLVDTVVAARRHTRFNTWVLSTDYAATPELTLVGGVIGQWFSDGNHRLGGLAHVVYSPTALPGFTAQLRVRRIDSEFRGLGYFSPDRLEEALALLQYGHAVFGDRFVLTLVGGGGAQRVDGRDTAALYQGELRGRGWFNDHLGLEGRLGCTNTGGINVQAASGGYRYCYGNLTLIGAF
ncbi:MAG: hypothetical protein QJR02_14620 [Sinobacteraceae bacterium]|jgi:hypothetical protein|nr:hypothetical protein [Nevskiaceae bacterium]